MHNFRSGDEVAVELRALVTRVSGDSVRVRFGDTEYDATPADLKMLKRSMHVKDQVVHNGREGAIVQSLEEGVFLVRIDGATGADAYAVAGRGELVHADEGRGVASAEQGQAAAETGADDALELTQPLAPAAPGGPQPEEARADEGQAPEAASAKGGAIGDMAASLTSMTRSAQRRQPLDLEGIGTTETVAGVRETRGEMTLGDDMKLGGSSEA